MRKENIMAKNKNSNYKKNNKSSKNQNRNKANNKANTSTRNTHAEVPDDSPRRDGPGGE